MRSCTARLPVLEPAGKRGGLLLWQGAASFFNPGLGYKVTHISASPLPVSPAARRYAGALFAAARGANCLDGAEAQMRAIAACAEQSEDFRRFIASPLYNAEAQERVIAALPLGAGGAERVCADFLKVLARHKRLSLLPQIAAAFAAQAAEARGEAAVFVTAAEELTEAQEAEIRAVLAEAAKSDARFGAYLGGKTVILHKRADPALLGGFVIRCGSLLIDASLRAQLSSLKLALKEVG